MTMVRAAKRNTPAIDYSALYDGHPEYVARRQQGSIEQMQIDLEVRLFKLPNLLRLVPQSRELRRVLEIGCATGELIAGVPVTTNGSRVGIDISVANVEAARTRFPEIEFYCGDLCEFRDPGFDAVILSDVLEHVPNDQEFLRVAARVGEVVLVNLPLEDNWLNRNRGYGPDDVSGHLRKYSLADGLELFERAGLEILGYSQVWLHETPADAACRALRRERVGHAFSGAWPTRVAKQAVTTIARSFPIFGRRLFSSNLFAAACKRQQR
ncbi:MAG: class I SAM-dependent methyltransferase [Variovorax sp.]|nr:MAG: class I SAM-dependent methyltransferase [Variovorax sp.]